MRTTPAPSALRQEAVASMSSEVEEQSSTHGASAKAAQMSARCAADFDGMALSAPDSGRGLMQASNVSSYLDVYRDVPQPASTSERIASGETRLSSTSPIRLGITTEYPAALRFLSWARYPMSVSWSMSVSVGSP